MTTWTGTAPTFTAGVNTGNVARLNDLRDAVKALSEPWTTYTPTWTAATVNPTLGNGSFAGSAYARIGKLVHFRIVLTAGSTTNFGTGQWRLTLPVTPVSGSGRPMFTMTIEDAGTGYLRGEAQWNAAGYLELFSDSTVAAGYERAVGTLVPISWATGDQVTITGTYEAA